MLDFIKRRRFKLAIFGLACIALLLVWVFCFWRTEIIGYLSEISRYFRDSVHFLEDVPLVYYSFVILLLPIFFLPVTPVFVLAAARVENSSYIVVLFFCLLGITANIIVSYFISRRFGAILRRKLKRRGINVPRIPSYEQYELTFLMRMIPGNPLAVQNYVLGAAGVSFFKYVIVSLPIQYLQVSAYVYFGEGIFEGGISKIILGSSILLIIGIIARMLEKRYGHKLKRDKDGISETE